jgi:hypothetical protein
MKSSDAILQSILAAKKATNINNSTTSTTSTTFNDINNSTTSLIVPDDHNQEKEKSLRSSLGSASQNPGSLTSSRDSINFVGGSELPAAWRGAKWDIYKNLTRGGKPSLKVKLSVIKQDKTTQGLTASLNSPHDRLWRGIEDRNTNHWQCVNGNYLDYRAEFGPTIENWRVSKFYLDSKKSSIDIMTLFIHWTEHDYCLRLILDGIIYDFNIPKLSYENLTEKQLKANQIATAFFGKSQVKMVHPRDLGLL